MSRRICVELYHEIVRLRPTWHDDGDNKGEVKVVMPVSASDPPDRVNRVFRDQEDGKERLIPTGADLSRGFALAVPHETALAIHDDVAFFQRYQNRAVEAAQVIEELIALANEMREADRRGEALGLSEEELPFYDGLKTHDSAVKVLGERAHLRRLVMRVLRKYGYPAARAGSLGTCSGSAGFGNTSSSRAGSRPHGAGMTDQQSCHQPKT